LPVVTHPVWPSAPARNAIASRRDFLRRQDFSLALLVIRKEIPHGSRKTSGEFKKS
jgi:hypothetical protein